MLLALRVKNFKSIADASIRFGPLTCLIGHNGAGKSNLFDVINFLSCLADREIHEAANEVRRVSAGSYSPLDLVFGRNEENIISISADMITSASVKDDFGQTVTPSSTLLKYTLELYYDPSTDRLLVKSETLDYSKLGDYAKFVGFRSSKSFRSSVAKGNRRSGPLISTEGDQIKLHGDGGSRGRPAPVGKSPLTVVGGTNTSDYPTVVAAKREMASWKILHLEPTAMRTPDSRGTSPHVSASGGNIAATLHSLAKANPSVIADVVNRLRQLNSDVQDLDVYSDKVREQLVLRAKLPGVENWLFGRSLSEGTLRYIALVLMLVDVQDRAVLCLEEPENGIHPSRVPSLVTLLQDYAVDLEEPVAEDNPLRQVILNSHSPEVARQLSFNDVVFVERATTKDSGVISKFRPVEGTWRTQVEDGSLILPKDREAVRDFIGGSPISEEIKAAQLSLEFGTAK